MQTVWPLPRTHLPAPTTWSPGSQQGDPATGRDPCTDCPLSHTLAPPRPEPPEHERKHHEKERPGGQGADPQRSSAVLTGPTGAFGGGGGGCGSQEATQHRDPAPCWDPQEDTHSVGSGTTAPGAPCSQTGTWPSGHRNLQQGLSECGDTQPGPTGALRRPPPLTIGTDGSVLVLPDQHQVHKVSGRNKPHGSRGGGGSGDAQGLSGPGGRPHSWCYYFKKLQSYPNPDF